MSVKLIFAHSWHYQFQKKKKETDIAFQCPCKPYGPLPPGPLYVPPLRAPSTAPSWRYSVTMSGTLIFAYSRHYKFQKKKEETENVSEVIRRPPPLLAPLCAPYGPQYRPPSGPLQTHTPRLPYGPLTGTPMGTTTGPPTPLMESSVTMSSTLIFAHSRHYEFQNYSWS